MRLWLGQSGIGLPNPDYYDDSKLQKVYEEIIRSAMTSVHRELDGTHALKNSKKPEVDVKYKEVYAFEKKLAGAFWDE